MSLHIYICTLTVESVAKVVSLVLVSVGESLNSIAILLPFRKLPFVYTLLCFVYAFAVVASFDPLSLIIVSSWVISYPFAPTIPLSELAVVNVLLWGNLYTDSMFLSSLISLIIHNPIPEIETTIVVPHETDITSKLTALWHDIVRIGNHAHALIIDA